MNFLEDIFFAISNVLSNKMRTFLTMIGIIIGISSVIAITSIGKGFENAIAKQFESLNSSSITIMSNWANEEYYKAKTTPSDVENLREYDKIEYASGYLNARGVINLKNGIDEKYANIIGVEPEYSFIQPVYYNFTYGGNFSDKENNIKSKVCIIDEYLAMDIFGRENVVGEQIKISIENVDHFYTVVGVTQASRMTFGSSIIVPLNTLSEALGTDILGNIEATVTDINNFDQTSKAILRILASNHNLTEDFYMILANFESMKQINETISILTVFISFVAAISLLVGGIGVMNIMLVTVTERTREIGIRKSIGATSLAIKMQFLVEAVFICLLGGIIGIIFGYLLSNFLAALFAPVFRMSMGIDSFTPVLSLPVSIFTMLISSLVGVVFGVYPAAKAAKLDPIEALRFD